MSKGVSEGDFDLSGPEMLDRSSADLDHALRDIDRRSPRLLFDGAKDFDDDGVVGREGMGSNVPALGRGRSKTDLWGQGQQCGTGHPQQHTDASRKKKTRETRVLPASSTDVIVRFNRWEDGSGVGGMGYLGHSDNRACA